MMEAPFVSVKHLFLFHTSRILLKDTEWAKIRAFIIQYPNTYLGKDEDACRTFLEAVKWVSRSGAQWRLLPKEYGNWNTVYKRFMRWCRAGVWQRMMAYFADEPDMEHGMIDSTIVRAHPCAAGAPKKN